MRGLFGGIWNPDRGPQRSGPDYVHNEARQSVGDARALQISAVFRCIRIIAEVAAGLPMRGYQKQANGDLVPTSDSHWLTGLCEEPNDTQTGDEWRECMYAQMAGWGNAYSLKVPNFGGRTVELWPLKVYEMQVFRQRDRSLEYRYPNMDGIQEIQAPGTIFHGRMLSIDGAMGLSPLAMARESLGITVGAERYAASFYAEGGRPAGIMTSDKLLTDKQREQIRREFGGIAEGDRADNVGVENQVGKRFWVLEGSLKYQAITVSPEDMQMLQTRVFQIADIARFFGVPLFLLMENSKDTSWGSGLEQLNLAFLAYTLRSYLRRMTTSFNRWIIPPAERAQGYVVDIDESPLQTLDSNALKELYGAYSNNGIMSRNEIRARLKLPRAKDGNADALTVQTALTTLSKLGTAPPAAAGGFPP